MILKPFLLLGVVLMVGCAHQSYIAQLDPATHASSAILGHRGPNDPRRYISYVAISEVDGVAYGGYGAPLPDAVKLPAGKHHVVLQCFGATTRLIDVARKVEQDIEVAPDTLYGIDVKTWIPVQDASGNSHYPQTEAGSCSVEIVETSKLAEGADLDRVVMNDLQRVARENATIPIRFSITTGILP